MWKQEKEVDEMSAIALGPTVKRGNSEQVVATPWSFIGAVEQKFGPLAVDLAATAENAKALRFITPELDTFNQNWNDWLQGGLGWLNPEYDPLSKWTQLCMKQRQYGATFLLLTPASVSTNWFWSYVQPFATVYCLTPRIAFVGSHTTFPPTHPQAGERKCADLNCEGCSPYPKDLMLSHYCANPSRELQRWRWKE